MAKMAENITVPMARASILWLIGEYSDRVPKIAPDVLRIMAKSFINEVYFETVLALMNSHKLLSLFHRKILLNYKFLIWQQSFVLLIQNKRKCYANMFLAWLRFG